MPYLQESETLAPGTSLNFFDTGALFPSSRAPYVLFSAEFARVGLGICYDIRFPELAMTSARQGKYCSL